MRMFDWQFANCVQNLKELDMNWDNVENNWKQCKSKVKEGWRKLTDDHLDVIADKPVETADKIKKTSPKEKSCPQGSAARALAIGCSLLVPAFFSSPPTARSLPPAADDGQEIITGKCEVPDSSKG